MRIIYHYFFRIPNFLIVGHTDDFLEDHWYFPFKGVFLPLNIYFFNKPVEVTSHLLAL